MRLLLAVFLFIAVISVSSAPAEEPENEFQPLVTYIRVDGRACVAHNAEQFMMLSEMVQHVNTLKRKKAEGYMDDLEYRSRVTSLLDDARSLGVRIN